jgi:putative RNA 2'-phosphotransferase
MKMHRKEMKRFGKLLSYALGIRPDEFGLVLDPDGFVKIKELLEALREEEEWAFLKRGHFLELMHSEEGKSFEWVDDRMRSTAAAGKLALKPMLTPPERLYQGVRGRAHAVVLRRGLRPNKGKWVVLASSREMALRIGRRRDPKPVIVEVKAREAVQKGIRFYEAQGLLVFTEFIPQEFITAPPLKQEKEGRRPSKPKPREPIDLPGSFFLDDQRILQKERTSTQRKRAQSLIRERKRRANRKRDPWRH